jgi:hypothetical protein
MANQPKLRVTVDKRFDKQLTIVERLVLDSRIPILSVCNARLMILRTLLGQRFIQGIRLVVIVGPLFTRRRHVGPNSWVARRTG